MVNMTGNLSKTFTEVIKYVNQANVDLTTLLLILASFVAGFLDSIVGGGGLISLPSLLALGLAPDMALGSNKVIGIATALASTSKYIHSKSIRKDGLTSALPFALVGAGFGAVAAVQISPGLLKYIIFFALLCVSVFVLLNRQFGMIEKKSRLPKELIPVFALLLGAYDGFFGPGTGTFLVIALVSLFGYSFLPASATGRAINLASNLGALLVFLSLGSVDLKFVWPGAFASFAGGICGATYTLKFGAKGIRVVLLIVSFALTIKLGISL